MLAILWREFRLHYTKVYWLIANFITPLFYMVFFGALFSRAINTVRFHGQEFTYLHFFIPGLIVMQSFLMLSHTLALVNLDRRTRIIEIITMSSTRTYEYYYGRCISTQILVILKTILLCAIAAMFFHFYIITAHKIIIFTVLLMVSNFIWFNVGFFLGLLIRTEDIRDVVMQLIVLPVTFLSNIYYPTENISGILRTLIYINPLTHATTAIRTTLLTNNDFQGNSILIMFLYAITTGIFVFVYISKRRLNLE